MPAVWVNSFSNSHEISMYPNPAGDYLILELNSGNNLVEISDVMGSLVFSQLIKSEKEKISTKSFSPGVYIVSVSNHGFQLNKRLLIAK